MNRSLSFYLAPCLSRRRLSCSASLNSWSPAEIQRRHRSKVESIPSHSSHGCGGNDDGLTVAARQQRAQALQLEARTDTWGHIISETKKNKVFFRGNLLSPGNGGRRPQDKSFCSNGNRIAFLFSETLEKNSNK